MFNTIRTQILAVATTLLGLFAITTGFSTFLNREVVEEMQAITEYHIPVGAHVASIDVLTYDLELEFRRVLAKSQVDQKQLATLREKHAKTVKTVREDIEIVARSLDAGIADSRNDVEDRIVMAELKGTLGFMSQRLTPFLKLGDEVLAAIDSGNLARARSLATGFTAYEDVFGKDLAEARKSLDKLTLMSITETEGNQKHLLWLNAVLFTVAAAFGLILFVALSNRLHRSLGELVAGTKQVEGGRLDVSLPVNSSDEIGQLTHSFNQMVGQLKEKEHVKDTFGKYLDPRIVARLIEAQGDGATVSERRPATLFFSDIKGFSGMSESLTANAMVNLLNNYFSVVTREIRDNHGIIDKFIGDAVMAFWTVPFSTGDGHASDACLAALAQQKAISAFRSELPQITGLRRNAPDFAVRMGLATGEVVIGTIGSEIAKSYTVIGDVVNTASRLEGVNKVYGTKIIIDETTYRYAQDAIEAREIDLLTVAGKTEPLRIYELICRRGELSPELGELRDMFAAGLAAYRNRDWEIAERRFAECLARSPDDGPARVFQQRLKHLHVTPPRNDWDGVWRLTEK